MRITFINDTAFQVELYLDNQDPKLREQLLSPDGQLHFLPCNNCLRPLWVELDIVYAMCVECCRNPVEYEKNERLFPPNELPGEAATKHTSDQLAAIRWNIAEELGGMERGVLLSQDWCRRHRHT